MRLGRIPYINCYPVYGAIDRGVVPSPGRLVTGTPSELNDLLAAGELDVSVVSAVEYARNAALYRLLPDIAVSSDGPVRSVALFSRVPVEDLDDGLILLSQSSRTSVLLLKLLCQSVWAVEPRYADVRAEADDLVDLYRLPHDAVLVIGDAALLLQHSGRYEYRYDLGLVWKEWTGLPFVFAVWAARRDTSQEDARLAHSALHRSLEWGLERIDELAATAARETGVEAAVCREYLSGLDYRLSYSHIEGLTSFFRRLSRAGFVAEGSLSFLSVA